MSTLNDIALWAVNDILNRPATDLEILSMARNAAKYVYLMICAKIPFDELQTTSTPTNLVAGQTVYNIGTDVVFNPSLRAIQNIRINFGPNNSRRMRRSHVRVYDSLSFTTSGQPATYARWDNQLIMNPAPDSSEYTWMFRYWFRPTIGLQYLVTAATWSLNSTVYSVIPYTGQNNLFIPGDKVNVTGIDPPGYNVYQQTVTAADPVSVTVATQTLQPPPYNVGGLISAEAPSNSAALWYNQPIITPQEWDELIRWETLYRVYYAVGQPENAATLMTQRFMQQQPVAARKQRMYEPGIIPRLWNDLLETVSQKENVDEDFNINPVIRAYSYR